MIPKALISSVLQGIHSSPFSGHLGINKSLFRARHRFYWPIMTVKNREYVSLCETCGQIKLNSHANKAPMQPIKVNEPFVFWAMLTWVPCQKLQEGKNTFW